MTLDFFDLPTVRRGERRGEVALFHWDIDRGLARPSLRTTVSGIAILSGLSIYFVLKVVCDHPRRLFSVEVCRSSACVSLGVIHFLQRDRTRRTETSEVGRGGPDILDLRCIPSYPSTKETTQVSKPNRCLTAWAGNIETHPDQSSQTIVIIIVMATVMRTHVDEATQEAERNQKKGACMHACPSACSMLLCSRGHETDIDRHRPGQLYLRSK